MSKTTLTLPELAEVVGVEYRTLHTWVRRGLLHPSLRSSSGTGSPNLFGFADAVAAQILADMRRGGLGIEQLEQAAEALGQSPSVLSKPAIVLMNGTVEVVTDSGDAAPALDREGLTVAFNTSGALKRVRSAMTVNTSLN